MERRTGDAPMDFEYENRSGRRDANSPWPKGDPLKHGFGGDTSTGPQNTASMPIFGTSSKPAPSFPFTPVKSSIQGYRDNPAAAVAFSDTENPSSPDNADNEDTPDPQRETSSTKPLPLPPSVTQFRGTSGLKESAFRRFSNSFSWGQSRDVRRDGGGGSSTAMILQRRAHKRKRPRYDELARRHRRDDYYSDSEADELAQGNNERRVVSQTQTQSATAPPQALSAVPAFFTFIHSHPDLPRILSSYGQTLLTWFLIAVLVFLVWTCWAVVRADVELAVQEAAGEIVREVGRCAEEFRRNGCGGSSGPPPALAMACREWHDCMQQDPLAVGRARVGARTFSRILNGFFEGMSWKFLAVVGVLLLLVAVNARALVPPFLGPAGPNAHALVGPSSQGPAPPQHLYPPSSSAAATALHPHQGTWPSDTGFEQPYFAPPSAQHHRRRSPHRRQPYGADDGGDYLLQGSPTRASPRRLGYS